MKKLILVPLLLAGCGEPLTEVERSRLECESKFSAEVAAEDIILQLLRSPSTAEFPSRPTVLYLGDCRHLVTSQVDAQNSFGATIRQDYAVEVKYSAGRWSLVDYAFQ